MKTPQIFAIEIATISLSLYWGVVLLLPWDTFKSSHSYLAMSEIGTEIEWAIFMTFIGSVQFLSMIINNYNFKRLSLIIATGVWFFVSSMFALSNPVSIAVGTYFIFGCLTGWAYLKVGELKYGC
ncbi:hypothetical protein ACSVDA_12040 [Cytobacillus sp. Hm23]